MTKKLEKAKKEIGKTEIKPIYDNVVDAGPLTNFITGKGARRIATAMIYERVGNSEVFLGGYPLLKGSINIGEYCVLQYKGKIINMDVPSSEMFTPCKDKKLNKIIEFVKFSDDDYRVRSKLSNQYYRKYNKPIYEMVDYLDDNGKPVLDENQEVIKVKVLKRDKNNELMYEYVEELYNEPLGVTQEGRDSIRIHNKTNQEIKDYKEKNESFWTKFNKHGGMTVVALAVVVMGMIMMGKFMTDAWITGVQELTGELQDVNDNVKWWQNADALDKITDTVTKKQNEANAPPIT